MESALLAYLQKLGLGLDTDFLRETLRGVVQILMDIEVSRSLDAGHYERRAERLAYRNGYRTRTWRTRVGEISLRIPKLRLGSYYPGFLGLHLEDMVLQLIEVALISGIDEPAIERLLADLNLFTVHQGDAASRLYDYLDTQIQAFYQRNLDEQFPYIWLDTVDVVAMRSGRRAHQVGVIAVGIDEAGRHRVLGYDRTTSEDDEEFWSQFLRGLVGRGLKGVRIIMSDAFRGLKAAIYREFPGVDWQYVRVKSLSDILSYVVREERSEVVAAISTIFVQPDADLARKQLEHVSRAMQDRWPQAALMLTKVEGELFNMASAQLSWMQLSSAYTLQMLKQALTSEVDAIGISISAYTAEQVFGVDWSQMGVHQFSGAIGRSDFNPIF